MDFSKEIGKTLADLVEDLVLSDETGIPLNEIRGLDRLQQAYNRAILRGEPDSRIMTLRRRKARLLMPEAEVDEDELPEGEKLDKIKRTAGWAKDAVGLGVKKAAENRKEMGLGKAVKYGVDTAKSHFALRNWKY